MCTTCGCSSDQVSLSDEKNNKHHIHHHSHNDERVINLEQDVLAKNNAYAEFNRILLNNNDILALNLVSSPGAGKTSLLVKSINDLNSNTEISVKMAVIEGDQQTDIDADRIRSTGVSAIQINTGKGCHLDGHMIGHAVEKLDLAELDLLFIENVGNLVCPAEFDLGEDHKIVILSVTEGEDKPLKYPNMFAEADIMIINKIDLLPYVDFDVNQCISYAKKVNPQLKVITLSVKTGEGLKDWYAFISHNIKNKYKKAV